MTWAETKLADHCDTITKGTTPTSLGFEFSDRGIPFVRVQNLSNGSVVFQNDDLFIDTMTHEALRRSKIYSGDVLLSIAGTIGRCAIVPEGTGELNCNQAVAIIRPKPTIDRRFLMHWISSRAAIDQIAQSKVTATIANLSLGQIGQLTIPLPLLDEQKRIAAILDQADGLRRKHKQALDRLNQLGQAIFYEMFGEDEGDVSIIEYIDDIQSGKNLVGIDDDSRSIYRVLKISAVSRNGFRPGETKPLPSDYVPPPNHIVVDGDLLFSRANTTELVGIPCIVEGVHENVALPDKLWRLVPSSRRSVSAFLCHALLSHASRRQIEKMCSGTSGSMQNISMQKFKSILVPRASLRDQIRFQDAIALVSAAKRDLENQGNRMAVLFSSLQQRAFRGEL
jgi:type I restriction enzyme S subunit